MKNNGWILWIVFILMVALAGAFSESKKGESRVYRLISERIISGTIDRVSTNRISVRTDAGTVQVFRIDPSRQPAFAARNIAKGDRIELSFDRNSYQVIEVHKTNEDGSVGRPAFLSNPPAHRMRFTRTRTE